MPSSREVAEHHARYVDPRRTDALADAMAHVHFEADDATARVARQAHARRFNWEMVASRTCDVYREIA
jgi:glycosyltransferase involved in cell wall biosynthesis